MNTTTVTNQLVTVDAGAVVLEDNIRTSAVLEPEFIDSIRQYGVLTPVSGRRDTNGTIHIRIGQRRTLAARETGQPLPVLVYDANDSSAPEPAWMKTAIQIVENDHRSGLTAGQRANAYRQMELDGLSITKIAGHLSVPKAQVKAGITVAKHPTLSATAEEHTVDLLALAAIAEFDDADVIAALTSCAIEQPEQLDHALERARRERDIAATLAARVAELHSEGRKTVTYAEFTGPGIERLDHLERDDTITVDPELVEDIAVCVYSNYHSVGEFEVMIDPAKYGYKNKYGTTTAAAGPMTDEQKAERRELIERNKAWDAAEAVRKEWLTNFVRSKSLPKDTAAFVAVAFTRFHNQMDASSSQTLAHEILGLSPIIKYNTSALANLVDDNPTKAAVVTLAVAIDQFEQHLSRATWRNAVQGHGSAAARSYFLQLRTWGYTLSPVEALVIGETA